MPDPTGGITSASSDEELSRRLHQAFRVEGHQSVTLVEPSPTGGTSVIEVTLADYEKYIRLQKMSGLERQVIMDKERRAYQGRLRKRINKAKSVLIDLDNGRFGYDHKGKKLAIDGMEMLEVHKYPSGVNKLKWEMGCFIDRNLGPRQFIRLISKSDPSLHKK